MTITEDMAMTYHQYLAIIFALSPLPALAASVEDVDTCNRMGQLAEGFMKSRQMGVPLENSLRTAAAAGERARPLVQAIARDAYARPRYHTPAMQQREIEEFKTEVTLQCLTHQENRK